MLCNVKCTACKIWTAFCGGILCKSVKLTEPPDAEPHVRWCERSAAKAASYSITVPEITEPAPEEKLKSTNMLPAILTLIVLACGGGFFVFKKVQEKKKAQEAAKPDPDADYVDDDEDYGYDPEFEDDDADSSVDEDDNEPV